MDKEIKHSWDLILRYSILIIIALPGLDLFYYFFMPLTTFPVYGLLNIFFNATLNLNIIQIGELSIEIIDACVAGAAYYFLLILNLATPKINITKRLKVIGISFGIFLIINILRIFILSLIYFVNNPIYEFTHKLFWYLGSTIFVVAIWFFVVKIFKIKKIPFYSDLKFLYSKSILQK
jgi:exosortase/archaeosortase family protein